MATALMMVAILYISVKRHFDNPQSYVRGDSQA